MDEMITVVADDYRRVMARNELLKGKVFVLEAELEYINNTSLMQRVFGWPWDKKYQHIKLVRRA